MIDEDNLRRVSEQLGIEYRARAADAEIDLPEAPTSTTDYAASGEVGNVVELYWIGALALIAMLAVEVALATVSVMRLRGLARPQPAPAPPMPARPAPTPPAPTPPKGGIG